MSIASRIASAIYKQLPVRKHKIYKEITGKALLLLKAGYTKEEVAEKLSNKYLPQREVPLFVIRDIRLRKINVALSDRVVAGYG